MTGSRSTPAGGSAALPELTVRTDPFADENATGERRTGTGTAGESPPTFAVPAEAPGPTNGHGDSPQRRSAVPGGPLDLSAASRGDVDRLVDRLYDEFARKDRIERERRGY